MKTYTLLRPSSHIVSESPISLVFTLHDREDQYSAHEKEVMLEHYFNDIYHLFLTKFSRLPVSGQFSAEDADALKSLLEEIVRVKRILVHK